FGVRARTRDDLASRSPCSERDREAWSSRRGSRPDWSSGSKLEVHQRIRYLVFSLNSDVCTCGGDGIGAPNDAGTPNDSEAIRCTRSADDACAPYAPGAPHNAGAPHDSGTLRSTCSPHNTRTPHHTGRPWISGSPYGTLVRNEPHGARGRVIGHSRRKSTTGGDVSAIQGSVEIKVAGADGKDVVLTLVCNASSWVGSATVLRKCFVGGLHQPRFYLIRCKLWLRFQQVRNPGAHDCRRHAGAAQFEVGG